MRFFSLGGKNVRYPRYPRYRVDFIEFKCVTGNAVISNEINEVTLVTLVTRKKGG